ncbi:hypothetical protein, partial [Halobacillus litoralis]|uniref:hypothetical protein n=1 Tax=Halobacillus litoralis TaxID=45668 RepID=UPI001F24B39B
NTLSIKYDININQVDDNYLKDYISQIISLSRIATLKYKAFTFSVNIKILSFVILGFLLIF